MKKVFISFIITVFVVSIVVAGGTGCKGEPVVEPAEEPAVEPAVEPAEEPAEKPATGVVTVLGTWGGDELTSFQEAVFPFTEDTGIGMAFEGTRDLAAVLTTRVKAGNPPDIAILPNPGQMYELAEDEALVDISKFMDMN
jgi:alpha-glucoside transport system substrate-binding protein